MRLVTPALREAHLAARVGKRSLGLTASQHEGFGDCLRIYKRKLLLDNCIRFDRRFRRSQDLQFTFEATLYAQNYYHLGDEYLYHNRITKGSLSRGYTKNMWSLYIPLIERLYRDTEDFQELNLMDQMHLRSFFWITDCIENELKSEFPYDKKTRVRLISEIINHPLCDRYYGHIEVEKLNALYKKYYELIYAKNAKGIISTTRNYRNKKKIKKYIRPTINYLTESKLTGTIYKRLRCKR